MNNTEEETVTDVKPCPYYPSQFCPCDQCVHWRSETRYRPRNPRGAWPNNDERGV